MRYSEVISGIFVSRPNRFIAKVKVTEDQCCGAAGADQKSAAAETAGSDVYKKDSIDGSTAETGAPLETVHVKNTGRCKELLVPGCAVYLSKSHNPSRKTKYDLIAVEKKVLPVAETGMARGDGVPEDGMAAETILINMDSQTPNEAAEEWLLSGGDGLFSEKALVRREVTFGSSRFDFYIEDGKRKAFLEVKGCTLEEDGIARFPDAPTERGVKHVEELEKALTAGYEAYLLIVIQMKRMKEFRPNDETHKAFGDALRHAAKYGVKILAYDCLVTPDSMTIDAPVPVRL